MLDLAWHVAGVAQGLAAVLENLRLPRDLLHHLVDLARVGGITPWLKVAHLAESFNVPVCPHFLMELHVGLCCAVPDSRWVEYIPQLDAITRTQLAIRDGRAHASEDPGLGIDWDWDAIERLRSAKPIVIR